MVSIAPSPIAVFILFELQAGCAFETRAGAGTRAVVATRGEGEGADCEIEIVKEAAFATGW